MSQQQSVNVAIPQRSQASVPVDRLEAHAFTIPTDAPESDGTLRWDSTTLVLVTARGGGAEGLGYSYTHRAAAHLIDDKLADVVVGRDALATQGTWLALHHAVRNLGRPGLCATAISAVDLALWDLKARVLDLPLVDLLPSVHERIPAYGSGGFTSYSTERLQRQLGQWADAGLSMVKMKVGRTPGDDPGRVRAAREAIGAEVDLFVDANGAYGRKQALRMAEALAEAGVTWFEEPVSSDDLEGLRLLRDRAPAGMDVTAGEYGYDLFYFRRMLDAGAVDVLQADLTRCGGLTGFLKAGTLCEARALDLSAHTAPSAHAHACCALTHVRHIEYFHDHARIEHMLFDGALTPRKGDLVPDRSRPGLGLTLKEGDAEPYRTYP